MTFPYSIDHSQMSAPHVNHAHVNMRDEGVVGYAIQNLDLEALYLQHVATHALKADFHERYPSAPLQIINSLSFTFQEFPPDEAYHRQIVTDTLHRRQWMLLSSTEPESN